MMLTIGGSCAKQARNRIDRKGLSDNEQENRRSTSPYRQRLIEQLLPRVQEFPSHPTFAYRKASD